MDIVARQHFPILPSDVLEDRREQHLLRGEAVVQRGQRSVRLLRDAAGGGAVDPIGGDHAHGRCHQFGATFGGGNASHALLLSTLIWTDDQVNSNVYQAEWRCKSADAKQLVNVLDTNLVNYAVDQL